MPRRPRSLAAGSILPRHQSRCAEAPHFHAPARLSRVSRACSRKARTVPCSSAVVLRALESLAPGRRPWDRRYPFRVHQWVTATHAIRWHRRHKTVGQGPLYQGRFKSRSRSRTAHNSSACAVTSNETRSRARLVRRAQDWPWCSLSQRLRLDTRVPLATAPFLASAAWTDHVNAAQPVRTSSKAAVGDWMTGQMAAEVARRDHVDLWHRAVETCGKKSRPPTALRR